MQRVAAGLQVSGDDVVGIQLPPGIDRVGASRARRASHDAPDRRIAGVVPHLLADALGQQTRIEGRRSR